MAKMRVVRRAFFTISGKRHGRSPPEVLPDIDFLQFPREGAIHDFPG